MNNIKLSIGIPVYNQAKTIRATIESALKQQTKAFEIVVCNNHSTDGTTEIVNEYKELIRIVTPPTHLKMAANWNYCVSQCQGQWVGLISGDDILFDNYVSDMLSGINADSEAIFVMAGFLVENKKDNTSEPRVLLSMPKKSERPKVTASLLKGPKASFAAFCFKKDIFDAIGGYDETFNLNQDWMLQFDFSLQKGVFVNVKKIVSQYLIEERPNLQRERIVLHIDDQLNFLKNKIWLAQSVGVEHNKIIEAGKFILYNLHKFMIENNFNDKLKLNEIDLVSTKFDFTKEEFKFNEKENSKNIFIHMEIKKIARQMYNYLFLSTK